jgi:ATP-dependent DNA helicase RecG
VANLVRDRRLLELAKNEASDFANLRTKDVTEDERAIVRSQLKLHWQRRYGLVEA